MLLLDLLFTAFIYLIVPIVIIIARKKYSKATIKKIMIINGICGFVLFSALYIATGQDKIANFAPALLWCSIGNVILNKTSCLEKMTFPGSIHNDDKVLYCRKCGEKLIENSRFCSKCGAGVTEE